VKPRLDPAPLTLEDQDILAEWTYQHLDDSWWRLPVMARECDRRDADLMLALREARQLCNQQGVRHCILAGHDTALAEFDDPDTSLVELGLAMRIPKL
jgi:hypothetical protein